MLRRAERRDIPAMHRVRLSVRENKLTSTVITEDDYVSAIEKTGRGWVIETDGAVVAFAVGNAVTGNIWALFVDPEHEGRGYGRRLLDEMTAWLFSSGLARLWLGTSPGTRAQGFYEAAGWRHLCTVAGGEALYELQDPSAP
jgi:GNAT superfamily N-acetyltransferase